MRRIPYSIPSKVKDASGRLLKTRQGEQLYWCKDGTVTLHPRKDAKTLYPNVETELRETGKKGGAS